MTEVEGFTPASRVVELFDGSAPGLQSGGYGPEGPVYVAGARYDSLADMKETLERGGPAGVLQAGGSRFAGKRYRRTHKGRRRSQRRLRKVPSTRKQRRNSRSSRR